MPFNPSNFNWAALAGLASGNNPGEQLGNANAVMANQAVQARELQAENQTRNWLAQNFPGEDFKSLSGDALKQAYNVGLQRYAQAKAPKGPDYSFLNVDGKIIRTEKNSGSLEEMADYTKPKLPAIADEYNYAVSQGFKGSFDDYRKQKDVKASDDFKSEQELWKNWRSDSAVKEYQGVRNGYEKIRASATDPTGAKDLGIIFGYMKMLDPESVVREGEAATVQNAGGVSDQIVGWYNRVNSGQKLPDSVRAQIVEAAQNLYAETAKNYEDLNAQVKDMAGRNNINPQFIAPAEKYEPLNLEVGRKIETTVNGKKATIERVPE